MIDREQLRLQKQRECEQAIRDAYELIPELRDIDGKIATNTKELIQMQLFGKSGNISEIEKNGYILLEQRRKLLHKCNLDESLYEPKWNCPKCKDKGYTEPGVLCQCYLQERLNERFERSGMSEMMKNYRFENFEIGYYTNPGDVSQKVQRCIQMIDTLRKTGFCGNLLLMGDVGCGKTHLSIAMANRAMENGNTVIYKRAEELFDLLRELKKFDREDNSADKKEMMDWLRECDLLVLDDLGIGKVTDFVSSQLQLLLDDRKMRNKPWIINTNLKPDEIEQQYGVRVADRIVEDAVMFRLECGESIRVQKRLQKQ